jgi:hypothetical protein
VSIAVELELDSAAQNHNACKAAIAILAQSVK